MSKQLSDVEYEKAARRGRRESTTEPRASRAYYDCSSRQVVVELRNKTKFSFPSQDAQGLAHATDEDLGKSRSRLLALAFIGPHSM